MASKTVTPLIIPRSIPGISWNTRLFLQHFYRAATWLHPQLAAYLALLLFITPGRALPTPADWVVMSQARRSRLPIGTGYVRLFEWGTEGPAVVLAHGWSSCAARLTGFVQPLLDSGFRVLAFDAPGHGGSSGMQATLHCFLRALRALLQQRGPVEAIVAHSYGALATLRLLMNDSDVRLRAAVLVSMPPDVHYMMEQFKHVLALREDVQNLLHAQFMRTFGQAPDRFTIEGCKKFPNVPTLIVHDNQDNVAPIQHAHTLVDQLPAATLLTTYGLDHSGPLRDAKTITAISEFLVRELR